MIATQSTLIFFFESDGVSTTSSIRQYAYNFTVDEIRQYRIYYIHCSVVDHLEIYATGQ